MRPRNPNAPKKMTPEEAQLKGLLARNNDGSIGLNPPPGLRHLIQAYRNRRNWSEEFATWHEDLRRGNSQN